VPHDTAKITGSTTARISSRFRRFRRFRRFKEVQRDQAVAGSKTCVGSRVRGVQEVPKGFRK